MVSRENCAHRWLMAAIVLIVACGQADAKSKHIRKLVVDPTAPIVPLFEGVDKEQFEVRVTTRNANEGQVFIENRTEEPLTVALPKTVVAIHVQPKVQTSLNQFGQGNGTGFGASTTGFGTNTTSLTGNSSGTAQNVGGGLQGSQNNPGAGNFFGQGFPSLPAEMPAELVSNYAGLATIPPGKSIALQLNSVCLNHGRRDPHPGLTYRLVPTESYSSDPLLVALLEQRAANRIDVQAVQAAVWHVANGLKWEELAQLPGERQPYGRAPLIATSQLRTARELVDSLNHLVGVNRPTLQNPDVVVQNLIRQP